MNQLDVLIQIIIASIQTVARGTGALARGVQLDMSAQAAGLNQQIDLPEIDSIAGGDVVPAPVPPAIAGSVTSAKQVTLDQHKWQGFKLTAEEMRAMAERGPEFQSVAIQQAVANLIDGCSQYIDGKLSVQSGFALGTPGVNPFDSNPDILMDAWKILADQKAPSTGRQAIYNTQEWAQAGKLPQFQKWNEAPVGTDFAMAQMGMLANFSSMYDQEISTFTPGTATTMLVNGAAAVGDTVVNVDGDAGTIAAGDGITFAADTSRTYVVEVGTTGAGSITLAEPLQTAIPDNNAITVSGAGEAVARQSYLLHPASTFFGIRPSAEMPDGDAAVFSTIVTDPISGLSMRLAQYKGYHQNQWQLSMVYGGIVRRPEWAVKLLA